MYIEIAVSVLVSVGFALYGMRLCLLRTQSGDRSVNDGDAKELAKVTVLFYCSSWLLFTPLLLSPSLPFLFSFLLLLR